MSLRIFFRIKLLIISSNLKVYDLKLFGLYDIIYILKEKQVLKNNFKFNNFDTFFVDFFYKAFSSTIAQAYSTHKFLRICKKVGALFCTISKYFFNFIE